RCGDGKQVDTGRQGTEAFEELEVLGDEKDESREREEDDRDRAAGGGEAQMPEQADVEHGLGRAALPSDEGGEQGRRNGKARDRAWRAPAVVRRLDDRE